MTVSSTKIGMEIGFGIGVLIYIYIYTRSKYMHRDFFIQIYVIVCNFVGLIQRHVHHVMGNPLCGFILEGKRNRTKVGKGTFRGTTELICLVVLWGPT